jgi:RND family efflux transporter MFP subunit
MRFYLLTAVALLIGLLGACKKESPEESMKRPVVDGVKVADVALSVVDDIYETTGTVRSDRESLVASRVMGVVTSVLVREGDHVAAGQLLLTIDDRDAVQRLRAAEMALEAADQNRVLAETTWRRYRNLYEEKAISRQEMDQVETQKKVAQAEYERAKAMAEEAKTSLSFTRVKAPVSGRITQKRIETGSMASPGMPLLVIEVPPRRRAPGLDVRRSNLPDVHRENRSARYCRQERSFRPCPNPDRQERSDHCAIRRLGPQRTAHGRLCGG